MTTCSAGRTTSPRTGRRRTRCCKSGRTFRGAGLSGQLRDSGEFARLAFGGLELVPPGVTLVSEWRQDEDEGAPNPSPAEVNCYGGVGRKRTA